MTARIELPCQQVAVVKAGLTDRLVAVPATVPCAYCEGRGKRGVVDPLGFHIRSCVGCDGVGSVPFSPQVGDPLDLVAVGPLPADGTRYGDWRATTIGPRESEQRVLVSVSGDALVWSRWLPLVPGEVLSVRVTEGPWPITLAGHLYDGPHAADDVVAIYHSGIVMLEPYEGEQTDITPASVFDPDRWVPGGQVVRVEVEP